MTENPAPPRDLGTTFAEFTLSGWSTDTAVRGPLPVRRNRRLALAYLALGLPSLLVLAWRIAVGWPASADWGALAALSVLALLAQYLPVHVSYANVSLGVGFLLAGCLLCGPAAGAAAVGGVAMAWSAIREVRFLFGAQRHRPGVLRIARTVYATGVGGLVYWAASTMAFAVFDLEAPVGAVDLGTLGASVLLTVGVYMLLNLASLAVSLSAGGDVVTVLRTVIPIPALAEFLALPAALLLAVTEIRLGDAAFALLAWLYLLAAFLGWRSWQDRENLHGRLRDLELLRHSGEMLSGTLDIGELVRRFHIVIRDVVRFDSLMLLIDDPGERLSQVFAFDASGHRADIAPDSVARAEGQPEGLYWEPGDRAVYTADLEVGESVRARLRIEFPRASGPSEGELALLETVCQQGSAALANARLYWLANTDPLTGVAIRRYFERALRTLAARGEAFAVVMLDIDWFKQINDSLGHRAGDAVLVDLAALLVGSLRSLDVAVRYGGEEFLALLPGSSSPEAAAAAERLRRMLDLRRLQIGEHSVRYTASFGVAASTDLEPGADPMESVWRADAALLEAKRAGKNQVVTYASLARSREPRRLDRPDKAR